MLDKIDADAKKSDGGRELKESIVDDRKTRDLSALKRYESKLRKYRPPIQPYPMDWRRVGLVLVKARKFASDR